jgi:anti-anti-sigma factor
MALTMQSSLEGQVATLALVGELDGNSAFAVRSAVEDLISANPSRLVLAVEHLTFLSSAGLRILIFAKQRHPALQIYLLKPRDVIVDTLKNTGFYDSVYVVDGNERAIGAA